MFDLALSDDGSIVSTRADYCTDQSARWIAIARKLATRGNMGRGYRLAVSRAGTWARRAAKAYKDEVTRSQRLTLARWEVEATRYEAREITAVQLVDVADHAMAAK